MQNNKPARISFSELRDIAEALKGGNAPRPFLRGDIGMIFSNSTLEGIYQMNMPYIMEEPRLALFKRGTARVIINMMEREIHAGMLVYLGKGGIMQVQSFSPDFDMCGIMISNERLNMAFQGNIPASLTSNMACFIVEAEDEETAFIERLFITIRQLIARDDYPDGTLNGLLHALLCYYDALRRRQQNASTAVQPHNRQMFECFIQLVSEHNRQHHSLAFYADKMCVTQRYLGIVVKNAGGITAKEWLDRALVTSAKILLRHTDRQVVQIADELNFSNPAFFCKFFRRMTGMSPQTYRKTKA